MGNPVIDQIINKKRHKDSCGEQSYVVCPICGRAIDYYWSKFAGVEWAKCRTDGCYNYNRKLIPRKKPKLIPRKKPKLKLRKRK